MKFKREFSVFLNPKEEKFFLVIVDYSGFIFNYDEKVSFL